MPDNQENKAAEQYIRDEHRRWQQQVESARIRREYMIKDAHEYKLLTLVEELDRGIQ